MTQVKSTTSSKSNETYARIYNVVRKVPLGYVATYGQIAFLCGFERHARQVGYALAHADETLMIPWHRVVNARGEISARGEAHWLEVQQQKLLDEGIIFDQCGRIDLKRFGWKVTSLPPKLKLKHVYINS